MKKRGAWVMADRTNPIVLSGREGEAFIGSLLRPDESCIRRRDELFAETDERVNIKRNGTDMDVDIPDMDLSFLTN